MKAEDGQSSLIDTSTWWCRIRRTKLWSRNWPSRQESHATLYFNIERMGNTSAASILMAIRDAVVDKRIDRPMRIFAPGFGAGSVGGFLVMRVDPAIVCCKDQLSVAVKRERLNRWRVGWPS